LPLFPSEREAVRRHRADLVGLFVAIVFAVDIVQMHAGAASLVRRRMGRRGRRAVPDQREINVWRERDHG
jgi:hypothetical protein